jgi:hypothetical protein
MYASSFSIQVLKAGRNTQDIVLERLSLISHIHTVSGKTLDFKTFISLSNQHANAQPDEAPIHKMSHKRTASYITLEKSSNPMQLTLHIAPMVLILPANDKRVKHER